MSDKIIFESVSFIESHKISGIALIPRVSRNLNFYLPEELARADGKTVPLNWEHDYKLQPIGQATFHYDKDLMQLRYEATISNDQAYDIIKNNTYHVSIGASPQSVKSICGSQQCYKVPEGLQFTELSLVSTPGIPESTINLVEASNLTESYQTQIPNYEFCDCTEAGMSPHSVARPDSDFAYVDKSGPASDRKFPIFDAPHVRNALVRFTQATIPQDQKAKVLNKICKAAKKFGIDSDVCKNKEGIKNIQHEFMGVNDNCEICGKPKTDYIHGMDAVYDTKDEIKPSIEPIGYKEDPSKNPHLATETITDFAKITKYLESYINELVEKKLEEMKLSQNTHQYIKADDSDNCKVCGQGSHSAIHADAPVHKEHCSKCGGVKTSHK